MVGGKKKMITFLNKIVDFIKNFKGISTKLNEIKVLNGNILSEIQKKITTQIFLIMSSRFFPNLVKTELSNTW